MRYDRYGFFLYICKRNLTINSGSEMKKIIAISILFIGIAVQLVANDEIFKAMHDEINRSMNALQLEGLKKPYYIEYTLKTDGNGSISSVLGETVASNNSTSAMLTVRVRVGSYRFDNTNFFDIGLNFFGSRDDEEIFINRTIPVELDYVALRRELWLATDAAYKQSAEIFSKKEASLKNKIRKDTTWDFTQIDKPVSSIDTAPVPKFDIAKYEQLANDVSKIFANFPAINSSAVSVEYLPETTYYMNSEGVQYVRNSSLTGIEITAFAQAEDGMPVSNYYSAYSNDPNDLPSKDSIIKSAKSIAAVINNSLQVGSIDESYSGPVLITGQAACEVLAQTFVPNLIAQRELASDVGFSMGDRNMAFQSKIGGRVLPEFMSVEDLPSLKEFDKTKLAGSYQIDDEGVLPQDIVLVNNGFLKTLLSDRVPTKRIKQSNGHKRDGAPMYSNVRITADKKYQMSDSDLKKYLIKLCKDRELPYGIIIRKIANQNIMQTTLYQISGGLFDFPRGEGVMLPIEAYKVYPNGKEELVRGVQLAGFSAQTFKDIIKTGDNYYVHNILAPSVVASFVTGGSPFIPASIISCDLLFEDAELRKIDKDYKRPPILSNPIGLK